MREIRDYSWCSDTIEGLKQKTIEEYLADIDLDNEIDLYDKLIEKFIAGSLDSGFDCPVLKDLDEAEKKNLLGTGRKYLSLCFSRGDVTRWVESVEGVTLGDYELICMKIFDNYNFVLNQLKNKHTHSLDRLLNFKNYGFGEESSIIESLRCNFYSEKALNGVLAEMNVIDGEYARFSDEHMSILCSRPEGVLYTFDENKEPVLYTLSDIQFLITTKMKELHIDETDKNYFSKAVNAIFMEYSDKLYEIILSDNAMNLFK